LALGDVVLLAGGWRRRLGVVLHILGGDSGVRAVLCHPYTELATDADVIVDGATPYALVVQFDLYANVWPVQIRARLGRIDLGGVALFFGPYESARPVSETLGAVRGIPLAGVFDGRWSFKDSELRDLAVIRRPHLGWFWRERL
jgi:hypothetical protein